MGHRALVAYQRPRGLYNLHYSDWGAADLQLKHAITAETPFGGQESTEWARSTFEALVAGNREQYEPRLDQEPRPETAVRPEAMATAITLDRILEERLDFLRYEAFYVVSTDFRVTAYRTLWFGLDDYCDRVLYSDPVGNGALATVEWYDGEPVGDACIRESFAAMKDVVGDLVDRGVFTLDEATEYLQTKLAAHVDARADLIVRTPGESEVTS